MNFTEKKGLDLNTSLYIYFMCFSARVNYKKRGDWIMSPLFFTNKKYLINRLVSPQPF